MQWNRLLKRYGYQVDETGVEWDPFTILATQAQGGGGGAKVSYTTGTSKEYGEIKCSVTVTVACPQTEAGINMAGEIAFRKAVELMNDGASHLGLPPVPPIQEV
jgi:hypothetical protein